MFSSTTAFSEWLHDVCEQQPQAARLFPATEDEQHRRGCYHTLRAIPHGVDIPRQWFNETLYEIYFRFLETADEYFDYAPANVPPQGRWRIYGIELPDSILQKVYYQNAAHLLRITS
jgi:hypothetical protein